MKNRRRVFLISTILIGSTAAFAYYSLNQFDEALDNFEASIYTLTEISSQMIISDKANKEQTSTTTPEIISTSTPEILIDLNNTN